MLVFSIGGGSSPVDTMRLDFSPGAVLQPPGSQYLFFTDEASRSLVRYDLTGEGETVRLQVDLAPPLFIATHTTAGTIVLVSRRDGQMRFVDMARLSQRPDRLGAGKPVTSLAVSGDGDELYLISATDCDRSEIHAVSVQQGAFSLRRVASLSGVVRDLAAPGAGGEIFAVAGEALYRISPGGGLPRRLALGEKVRGVAVSDDRVFVSAGLDHVYALDRELGGQPERVRVEMGPGPLLVRAGKLYAVNCLSNSVTVLDVKDLEEDVSVLLGVLLGRMYYNHRQLVVNNLFRHNVMVLNPETYIIEEIIRAGGSIHYDSVANAYAVFDDSVVTRLPAPPSAVSVNSYLPLPNGVRIFAPGGNADIYFLADQNRYISRVNLGSNMIRGNIPLPSQPRAIAGAGDGLAFVMTERELCTFSSGGNVGLDRTWSARPARFSPPWLADDGFTRARGSQLIYATKDRLHDVFTTSGEISAIRNDPDSTLSWIAAGGELYVFDSEKIQLLSSFHLHYSIVDIILPPRGQNAYAVATDQVVAIDRKTLLRYDEIRAGGYPVYAREDDLYLLHPDYNRRLIVADGIRGDVFQEVELPLTPTDAAASDERLFLLGAAQGAVAIYVNRIDSARLPRSADHRVWDSNADRRAGYHR